MVKTRIGTRRRSLAAIGGVALLALMAAACGSDANASDATTAAAPASAVPVTAAPVTEVVQTTPSTEAAATGDEALAEQALLTGSDIGDGWETADDRLAFPNSAELARTIPECADFAELVFDGGAQHGAGRSRALLKSMDLLFTYVVVFPTEEEAAAMVAAASTPAFDQCWAAFNDAAVPLMPVGATSASYEVSSPPALTLNVDSSTVKYLEGFVTVNGTDLRDTCVCAFAQVGRGVVEVHSVEPMLDAAARSKVVQAAIDRLRSTLA